MSAKSARRGWSVAAALLLALLAGCKPPAASEKRYPLQGEVVAVDTAAGEAVIRHGDIPGYMKGMTMGFALKDRAQASSLRVGQHIRATLVVAGDNSELENVEVVEADPPATDASSAGAFHLPTAGEAVPEFHFTDQDGHPGKLSQYRGKTVLLSFIYTRCPLPDFCPRITANFREIEHALQSDPALFGRTRLLLITLDPEFDTPAVLRSYAVQSAGVAAPQGFAHWQFLQPRARQLSPMAHFFGLTLSKEDGQIIHSLSTAVIGPDGKVAAWHHGGDWTRDDLLREIRSAAQ